MSGLGVREHSRTLHDGSQIATFASFEPWHRSYTQPQEHMAHTLRQTCQEG